MANTFAYVRVSTKDQNERRQLDEMRRHVRDDRFIYVEKESGKDFNRPGYQKLKRILSEGDTLIVKSLDRLGRNYTQIKEEWGDLLRHGVQVRVLDFPLLDTARYGCGDLMTKFLANVVFEVLSFVAENERNTIRERQREGIAAAKRAGVHFGRAVVRPPEFERAYLDWQAGRITAAEAIRRTGMARSTFYKRAREERAKEQRAGAVPAQA